MASSAERKYLEAQNDNPAVLPIESPQPVTTSVPAHHLETERSGCCKERRGIPEAYALGIPFGFLGLHHVYLRRPKWGALYFFTVGLFGVGWVVDWIRMPWLVRAANKPPGDPSSHKRSLVEAYMLWMPLGLFGAHHYYLKQWGWAVGYNLTMGFFGLGWLMDAFLMPSMVRDSNEHLNAQITVQELAPGEPLPLDTAVTIEKKTLATAYRLCLCPITGLFGAHHYYLGRTAYGLFYTFTLGGLGLAWFSDWFRLCVLVKDANKRRAEGKGFKERRLDDCYLAAIPCGLFGAHHFYLGRVGWGFLYFFTVGCLGIGWIIDLIRMPKLLQLHKAQLKKKQMERLIARGMEHGGAINPAGPDGAPTVPPLVVSGGSGPPQYVQQIGPGVFAVTTNGATAYPGYPNPPPKALLPGVHSALPPPGYEENGFSSFSTIDSSEVDQPPSYQDALHETSQNAANNLAEAPLYPVNLEGPAPSAPHGRT